MSKIGFITIQHANYGSVLQTFATYYVLKKMGHDPVLIDYQYPTAYHKQNAMGGEAKRFKLPLLERIWKNIFSYSYRLFNGLPVGQSAYQKWVRQVLIAKYQEFQSQLNVTPVSYDMDSILKNPPVFDVYMTGSDQTWNPRYYANDYSFLLNFAPDTKPKFAYAASYGTSEFYSQYAEDYGKFLKRYDAISTRESTGVELTKNLSGKEAVHCCDPTLLLTKDDWMQFAAKENPIKEKYILVYMQTYAVNPYPYSDKLIQRIKKLIGIDKVVVIGSEIYDRFKGYALVYDAGPQDFLRLFADATFVVCCSFHSVAFSINFRKPFYAIAGNQKTTDNRQSDILKTLNLESRTKVIGSPLPTSISDITLDYTLVEEKIQEFRTRSFDYLNTILSK
ncbi:MAG: polysaccharide pyruvyl transferase family protein [Paludibacteraceae bacterium]|nr:polysaccharide pyruvyl transferase family protein [Paludibacteraceae bacterium]